MERLTKKDNATPYYMQYRKKGFVKMRNKAIFRLWEYEETGLTPQEISKLKECMVLERPNNVICSNCGAKMDLED